MVHYIACACVSKLNCSKKHYSQTTEAFFIVDIISRPLDFNMADERALHTLLNGIRRAEHEVNTLLRNPSTCLTFLDAIFIV